MGIEPKKIGNVVVLLRFARYRNLGVVEHLGLDLWKCVIFRRLVCLLLFIC